MSYSSHNINNKHGICSFKKVIGHLSVPYMWKVPLKLFINPPYSRISKPCAPCYGSDDILNSSFLLYSVLFLVMQTLILNINVNVLVAVVIQLLKQRSTPMCFWHAPLCHFGLWFTFVFQWLRETDFNISLKILSRN